MDMMKERKKRKLNINQENEYECKRKKIRWNEILIKKMNIKEKKENKIKWNNN